MCLACLNSVDNRRYLVNNAKNYDPTRTTTLRNVFASEMRKRFNFIIRLIRKAIIEEDVFGLREPQLRTFQRTPGEKAFAFDRSQQKVQKFMQWLNEQVAEGILTISEFDQFGTGVEGAWTNKYIADSYKRGVQRARYETINAGFTAPTLTSSGGILAALTNPFHIDRLGLIYTRTFNDLKGITANMDLLISRVLAEGMANGDGPTLLARKITSVIDGSDLELVDSLGRFIPARRRAEILARTEIIRAHHAATIQEYRNFGVIGVDVVAEFVTAGDARVCQQCKDLAAAGPYTLDQIEPLIPAHPQCRCIALPQVVESNLK